MNMSRLGAFQSCTRQRGMATILIVLLAGLSITATTLGVMYTVRSTQDQQMASHASTEAESLAWTGVELLRLYLTKADLEQVQALALNSNIIGGDIGNSISARRVAASAAESQTNGQNGEQRFAFEVTGRTELSSSTLRIVYAVIAGDEGNSNPQPAPGFNGTMNIYDNLTLSGGLKFLGGENVSLNIEGSVNISGGVQGVNVMRSTGDMTLSGGTERISQLVSNGNITITGGASADMVSAIGNIRAESGASQGVLNSNGNIIITNGSVTTANARGLISSSSGGSHGTFTAGKSIDQSNGTLQSANAVGDITISSWPTLRTARSQGSVTCPSQYWTNFTSIHAGVAIHNCPRSSAVIAPTAVTVTVMSALTPFTLTRPTVDARPLETAANYVFKHVGGKEQITVRNITGLPDGNYRLGRIKKNWTDQWGYLCKETDAQGYCMTECSPIVSGNCQGEGIAAIKLFCHGQSLQNKCLDYNTGTRTWTFNGSQNNQVVAPGVLWFEGNLTLGNGLYRSTMLATGNINAASGSVTTHATNHVGYTHNCRNSLYGALVPSNFCQGNELRSIPLGNIALLAGSYNGSEYVGGNIAVGSSTKVFGDVIAGNQISGGGGATVQGYITAAGLGNATSNSLSGGLTIDLRNLPASYTPGEVPDMGGDTGGGGSDEEADNEVRHLWIRPV